MEIPFIFLNAAITIDGKIATRTGNVELSSEEDWKIVHNLRNKYQGLMVGGNTARQDDPKLTVKEKYIPKDTPINYPTRIVVDSKALLRSNARCLTFMPEIKTIIGVSKQATGGKIKELKEAGAEIIQTGNERVDLLSFLEILKNNFSIDNIMLEGGGMLIWSMLELKILKKFRFYIAPRIVGGESAISVVRGRGYGMVNESPKIIYTKCEKLGEGLVIEGNFQF